MKSRIERSIEQRTAMLAGVSHDLRTILTRFKLELALIGDSPEVDGMRKDVDEMSGMLEDYLAFARGDSGEQAQPTDMAMALEELRSDAERNGHAATVAFHGLPVVTVKPASFKRCLGNLVSNAARHANALSITGHRDHRYLTVTIDDDGPGIPPDMREEVFKPFLRLDDARNQDEGGTGLGLAIARDIARSHGGDITLGDSPMGGLRASRADTRCKRILESPALASVARDQRPLGGAIGHPAAGKRNVAAILRVHTEELHHLAVSGAVVDCELTDIHLRRQRIGDDAAGVVALERRHIIGPRRRASQHSAYRNQARSPHHSHRKLHFGSAHLKAHRAP